MSRSEDSPRNALSRVRCAIYTRKSSEENLDMEFNSLDAQREAAESYIASQRQEGWVALPTHYDDGGFSGATIERPALHPEGQRAALIVSGHTHGGQVWMPTIIRVGMHRFAGTGWPPKSDYGRAHPYGLMHERWGWSYITSGVVQRFTLPRWFTEAEAAVLELQ
jgi:hypothetical protein